MPLHTDTAYDQLSALVQLKTSTVLEMILSLQTAVDAWRRPELTEEINTALGRSYLDDLRQFFSSYHQGCDFAEIGVDTEFHHDLPGFLESVKTMEPSLLAFYILGRRFAPEDIPDPLSAEGIRHLIAKMPDSEELLQYFSNLGWADNIEQVRTRLLDFWETYWNRYFKNRVESFNTLWDANTREKREFFERNGGAALFQSISGMEELPPPIPREMPYTRIEFFPFHAAPMKHMTYYGYGVVTVLYDCTKTEERGREIRKERDDAIAANKALGDKNRLKILKLISLHEKSINGQKIAHRLELSPSVVSRHLNMLKEAGLVEEFSPDNRNITYSVNIDVLTSLPEKIQNYFAD
jgi:DNA-binding transcriptional ArsR family regulator